METENKKEINHRNNKTGADVTDRLSYLKNTSETNTDFDKIIDRRNTDCLKYDFAVRRGRPADVLPLWVADMDFPTSSRVIDAVVARAQHGIFGYTETGDSYFEAVADWMHRHHGWEVQQEWLVKTPGVVFALAMAVKAFTEPGDAVLIQQPVYYPFSEVIKDNGRVVVSSDLVLDVQNKTTDTDRFRNDGTVADNADWKSDKKESAGAETGHDVDVRLRYRMDFADLEQKIIDNHVKLFLLCSPHNPVGRVWTKEELQQVGEICLRHHVIVVADEIHEDFVFGEHKHTVFASLQASASTPESASATADTPYDRIFEGAVSFRDFTITCTSPAKTFNLAGLQVSNIFIPNRKLRYAFKKQISASGYSQLNTLGLTAAEAAYRYGEEWYQEMMSYVGENLKFLKDYLAENLPQIRMTETEGTYLAWLDCRNLEVYKDSVNSANNPAELRAADAARGTNAAGTADAVEAVDAAGTAETTGDADARLEQFITHEAKLWLDSGAIFGKSGQGFERINAACPRSNLQQALTQLKAAVDGYHYQNETRE